MLPQDINTNYQTFYFLLSLVSDGIVIYFTTGIQILRYFQLKIYLQLWLSSGTIVALITSIPALNKLLQEIIGVFIL